MSIDCVDVEGWQPQCLILNCTDVTVVIGSGLLALDLDAVSSGLFDELVGYFLGLTHVDAFEFGYLLHFVDLGDDLIIFIEVLHLFDFPFIFQHFQS